MDGWRSYSYLGGPVLNTLPGGGGGFSWLYSVGFVSSVLILILNFDFDFVFGFYIVSASSVW